MAHIGTCNVIEPYQSLHKWLLQKLLQDIGIPAHHNSQGMRSCRTFRIHRSYEKTLKKGWFATLGCNAMAPLAMAYKVLGYPHLSMGLAPWFCFSV